jgi:hypothetical protein
MKKLDLFAWVGLIAIVISIGFIAYIIWLVFP